MQAEADTLPLREYIEQQAVRFENALESGDLATLAELYTPDALLLEPLFPPVQGRENIQAYWAGAKQMGLKRVVIDVTDVELNGDLAIEIGNYRLTVEPPGEGGMTDEGKFMLLWKRQPQDTWKIYRHMSNTSTPMSTPPQ